MHKNESVRLKNTWTQMSPRNFKVHLPIRFLIAKYSCSHLTGKYLLFSPGLQKVPGCTFCRIHGQALLFALNLNVSEIALIHQKSNFHKWLHKWMFDAHVILQHAAMPSASPELSHYLMVKREKAMATHSSILAWRVPGMGEPGGLPSMGPHRVGHNWSDLAAAAVW